MARPDLKIFKDKDGAAVAELRVPTSKGERLYVAAMQPGELATVRARVEAMARAHGDRLAGDSDDVIAPSSAKTRTADKKTVVFDADAPMEPSSPSSGKKPAPRGKVTFGEPVLSVKRNFDGPARPGLFNMLNPFRKSGMQGEEAAPTHCVQLPDGTRVPVAIVHCDDAAHAARAAVNADAQALDVDTVVGAHIREALVSRVTAKVPPRLLRRAAALELKARGFKAVGPGGALVRGSSEVGVTNFKNPDERFVDDALREEQMERAGRAGSKALDDFEHDGVFGVGAEIEDGVVNLGPRRYDRGDIVEPAEFMDPPEDLLWRETLLEAPAVIPKNRIIKPDISGTSYSEQREDAELARDGEVGYSLNPVSYAKKAYRGVKKGAGTALTTARVVALAPTALALKGASMVPVLKKVPGLAAIQRMTWNASKISQVANAIGSTAAIPVMRAARGRILATARAVAKSQGRSAVTKADRAEANRRVLHEYATFPANRPQAGLVRLGAAILKKFGSGVSGEGVTVVGLTGTEIAAVAAACALAILAANKFLGAPKVAAAAPGDPADQVPPEEAYADASYANPEYADESYAAEPTYEDEGAYADESMGAAARRRPTRPPSSPSSTNVPTFVASRDGRKLQLVRQTRAAITDRLARFRAWRGGRPAPTQNDVTQAGLQAQKILVARGLPVDVSGCSTAGAVVLVGIAGEAALPAPVRVPGHLPPETRRLAQDLADVRGCLVRGVERARAAAPGAAVVGAWYRSEAWFRERARQALADASRLAPDADSLPPVPAATGPAVPVAPYAPSAASASQSSAPGPVTSPGAPGGGGGPGPDDDDMTDEERAVRAEQDGTVDDE